MWTLLDNYRSGFLLPIRCSNFWLLLKRKTLMHQSEADLKWEIILTFIIWFFFSDLNYSCKLKFIRLIIKSEFRVEIWSTEYYWFSSLFSFKNSSVHYNNDCDNSDDMMLVAFITPISYVYKVTLLDVKCPNEIHNF